MKGRIKALDDREKEQASTAICGCLATLPVIRQAKRLMAFLHMPDEVNIDPFLAAAIAAGKEVYVPLCLPNSQMKGLRLVSLTAVQIGAYGIRTACSQMAIDPADVDCILVPGLAFDGAFHRLGRGGGYYDRYLPKCTKAFRLAVAWDMQHIDAVPVDSHDCFMDAIVTEQRIITNTRYPKRGEQCCGHVT